MAAELSRVRHLLHQGSDIPEVASKSVRGFIVLAVKYDNMTIKRVSSMPCKGIHRRRGDYLGLPVENENNTLVGRESRSGRRRSDDARAETARVFGSNLSEEPVGQPSTSPWHGSCRCRRRRVLRNGVEDVRSGILSRVPRGTCRPSGPHRLRAR